MIFLSAAACSYVGLERSISANERKWGSQGITSYEIDVMRVSIWHLQNHHLVVRDGEIVEATATCQPAPLEFGKCEVDDFQAEDFTVEGLFRIARSQASIAGGQWTEIEFDEQYGFPTRIAYDSENAVDEEVAWRVMGFEILP